MQSSASSSWLAQRVHAQMHLSCSPLSEGIAIYKLNLEARSIARLGGTYFCPCQCCRMSFMSTLLGSWDHCCGGAIIAVLLHGAGPAPKSWQRERSRGRATVLDVATCRDGPGSTAGLLPRSARGLVHSQPRGQDVSRVLVISLAF